VAIQNMASWATDRLMHGSPGKHIRVDRSLLSLILREQNVSGRNRQIEVKLTVK
jgi:hypothetical protein